MKVSWAMTLQAPSVGNVNNIDLMSFSYGWLQPLSPRTVIGMSNLEKENCSTMIIDKDFEYMFLYILSVYLNFSFIHSFSLVSYCHQYHYNDCLKMLSTDPPDLKYIYISTHFITFPRNSLWMKIYFFFLVVALGFLGKMFFFLFVIASCISVYLLHAWAELRWGEVLGSSFSNIPACDLL